MANFFGTLTEQTPESGFDIDPGFDSQIFDAAGAQTLNVFAEGSLDLRASDGGNTINLEGSSSDYTVSVDQGGNVTLTNTNTEATISLAARNTAQSLVFADGATDLVIEDDAIQLGDQNITEADGASISATLDESTTSQPVFDGSTPSGEISGSSGDDTITPDSEDEDFVTSDADETINGGAGNDLIDGGGGADSVNGEAGNDTLVGDPADPALDGGEGFDTLEVGAVSGQLFGTDSDEANQENGISLQPVSNVQLIDARNSEGGNTFDLSDQLIDSITGGENTFGVLENSLSFLVSNTDDEIDLGDVSSSNTVRVISESGNTSNLDITNPNDNTPVVELTRGENAVLDGGDFTVAEGESFYIGSDANETLTADYANLDENDTLAAGEGEDTLSFTGSALPGEIPLEKVENISGIDVLAGEAPLSGNLVLTNELLGQFVRGEPNVEGADTFKVVGSLTIDTQDVGKDDTVILEGGEFNLANPRGGSTLLQGNIVTISDNGAGTINGGEGNDSINGGTADDVIDLSPEPPRAVSSGNNVVSGGQGNDEITAGTGQDNLSGDEGNDTFNFGLNNSGVSRLNANDTVAGGGGTDDTVDLVANTVLASQSEVQNVTGVETIQLNGDGDASASSAVSSDSSPVNNEFTVIDNLVDTTSENTTLTIDASNNSFNLINNDNFTLANGGTFDRNVIDLTNLSADSEVAVEGGNASEQLVFSDASFNGLFELNGGQGGIDPSSVGLPVAGSFEFTPSVPLPVSSGTTDDTINPRLQLANSVSNIDTLQFEAEGGNTFTADPTDFNQVTGFEEIQLTNTQDGALSNFNITFNDQIVRDLTQPASTDSSTNLFVSLDVIDQIGQNSLGKEIGQNSNINIDATELTNTLNTVTVLNPNGVSNVDVDGPSATLPTRVNVVSADIISTAELGQANGETIYNDYANSEVDITIGNNFDDITPAVLSFDQAGDTENTVVTGNGDFNISTGGQDDNITTGSGDDTLTGGLGVDTLEGGEGADVYNFNAVGESPAGAPDTIIGFAPGTDQIDVSDLPFDRFFGTFNNATVAEASAAADGGNVLAFIDDTNSLVGFQGGTTQFEISFEDRLEGEFTAGEASDEGDILGAVDAEPPELSTLSFANTSLTVNESADSANLTVELSNALPADSEFDITFTASTTENTATAVSDFGALNNKEFTTEGGQSSVEVPIQINDDNQEEDNESFDVTFSTESNLVQVENSAATVTIEDNDGDGQNNGQPELSFANTAITVNEGDGNATLSVELAEALDSNVTFTASTSEGTATAGDDFTALDGEEFSIAAGETTAEVSVAINDDNEAEDNETFDVSLATDSEQVALGNSVATVTVQDNEPGNGGGLPDLPGNGGPAEVEAGTGEPDNINGDQDGATLSGGAGLDRFIFDNVVNDQGDPQAQSVTIDDFSNGEQLFFEGGFSAGDISVSNQDVDGEVTLGIRNTDITISELSDQQDQSILGVSGFEDVFGDQALGFA